MKTAQDVGGGPIGQPKLLNLVHTAGQASGPGRGGTGSGDGFKGQVNGGAPPQQHGYRQGDCLRVAFPMSIYH